MANFNLLFGSLFNPFTFQEMLTPVLMAQLRHELLEDIYSELDDKASIWENMASEENDPIAYNLYKLYSRALETVASQLASLGLTPSSRKTALSLKSRYNKEIAPIELAYARRKELLDELRKALLNNPTLRFLRNFNEIGYDSSLDRFIQNPNYDYGESYSGALLTKQVSDAVSSIKGLIYDRNIGKLESLGIPYLYTRRIRKGANPNEVIMAMLTNAQEGEPETVTFLRNTVNTVLKSSGIADWADAKTYKELVDFANLGLYSAIGSDELKEFKDDYNMQLELLRNKLKDIEDTKRDEERQKWRPSPKAARSQEMLANKWIKRGLVQIKDGKYEITTKGLSFIDSPEAWVAGGVIGSTTIREPEFYKFLQDLKAYNSDKEFSTPISKGEWLNKKLNEYYSSEYGDMYDTWHGNEYDILISGEDSKKAMELIRANAPSSGELQILEYSDRLFKPIDDIDISDLKDYIVTNIRPSKYGITAIILKKDGDGEVYRIPYSGINSVKEANTLIAVLNAEDWRTVIHSKYRPAVTVVNGELKLLRDKKGDIIFTSELQTIEDKIKFSKLYDEAILDIGENGASIVKSVTSKPVTIE